MKKQINKRDTLSPAVTYRGSTTLMGLPFLLIGVYLASEKPWSVPCFTFDRLRRSTLRGNREARAGMGATPRHRDHGGAS